MLLRKIEKIRVINYNKFITKKHDFEIVLFCYEPFDNELISNFCLEVFAI